MQARRGFTLFEVMAAVIVLGLLYSLLASTAVQGLRAEGTSRRKLEASLRADEFLAELENTIALGGIPDVGVNEEEVGDFLITVNVAPFDPTLLVAEPPTPDPSVDSLLALPASGGQAFVRSIEVVVSWVEGLDEHSVRRTTFAYDAAAAEAMLPTDFGPGGEGAAPGEDGDTRREDGGDSSQRGEDRSGGGSSRDAELERMIEQFRSMQ